MEEIVEEMVIETFYGFPDDIVCYEDISFVPNWIYAEEVEWVDFYATRLARDYVRFLNAKEGVEKYLPQYTEWRERCVAEIKEQAEAMFPGRWDFQAGPQVSSNVSDEELAVCLSRIKGDMKLTSYDEIFGKVYGRLVLHFPLITIRNTQKASWPIKDFYFIIEFNYRMGVKICKGYRATKTYKEYTVGYNFSHAKLAENSTVTFCFGSTSLDELLAEMSIDPYDAIKTSLLLQQIEDYLSWESIDSGPYYPISNLLGPEIGGTPPNMSNDTGNRILKQCLLEDLTDIFCILHSKQAPLVAVGDRKKLQLMVSKHCPKEFLFPVDSITGRTLYGKSHKEPEDIDGLNRDLKRGVYLQFKGQAIYLTIEKADEGEKKNIELLADERIVTFIRDVIINRLNDFINERYWSTYKKGSVQEIRAGI